MRVNDLFEDDREHSQALQQTGFWGRRGAGCLILARDTHRICIAHRSQKVEQPGTWGTWGGAIDADEDPAQAAQREVSEEAGYSGPMQMVPLYVFKHRSGFTYYNFLAIVDQEFKPRLDWETQGYSWVKFGQWPRLLHPGLQALLSDAASLDRIRRALDPHPQRGQHYPSIETIGYDRTQTESLVTEKEPDEIAVSPSSIHSKLGIPGRISQKRQDKEDIGLLRYYTGSGSKNLNNLLHTHYRNNKFKDTFFKDIGQLDNYLTQFKLEENLKVYTGIPESPARIWSKYNADPTQPVRVHLPAYTSTTTNYNTAFINFAKVDNVGLKNHPPRNIQPTTTKKIQGVVVYPGYQILHITVPKGYPALSLKKVTQYKDEEEILLPRGLDVEIDPRPYIKPTPGQPGIIWFAKVVGHNPVVLK